MKQVLQHLRTGRIELADVPCPRASAGHVLIQTRRSLISPGTERMLVEFGQAGLIAKARSQPDKVRQVLDKIRTDGLLPTVEAVFNRLDEPMPMGYCNAGVVVEVGSGVKGFTIGDRVVSNGPHAEMVHVPMNLVAKIPEGVSDDAAAFTVMGAIGLQGIRLLAPTFGECFVVVGLGLVGLLTVQLLRANGCQVLGVDVNKARCDLARDFGCQVHVVGNGSDPVRAADAFSGANGVDGVLITASSKSDEIMHQAAEMCRKRGRIVLVGTVGLNLRRADFYNKELTFQVSCSYGPGRYDPNYEDRGQDYPLPFVRWTEARNFDAVLAAIAAGRLDVGPLISRSLPHSNAATAYQAVLEDSSVLGVTMIYPEGPAPTGRVKTLSALKENASVAAAAAVGIIGAGNFTKLTLLPALSATPALLKSVASAGGVSGFHAGRKFGSAQTTSDYNTLLQSEEINTIFITTRHGSHPAMVAEALKAGKHVFVEKPLAVDEAGLEAVRAARAAFPNQQLMVGFNRRFAPHSVKAKQLLSGRGQPIAINILVNGGDIPGDAWFHDPGIGGGRIIGEGCHFIDLAMFLVGSPITSVQAVMFGPNSGTVADDKTTISLTFADGSIGSVMYWCNGPKSYPKEQVTIFSEGRVLEINNWRGMKGHNWSAVPRMRINMDKGHRAEVAAFIERVGQGGEALIPFAELDLVTQASFAAVRSAREGITIHLEQPESSHS